MPFKDHFSQQSSNYAKHRPAYPHELFLYLSNLSPGRDLAWDVATGSGQAALAIAEFFDRVVATDGSAAQISHAQKHPSISYLVETAEHSSLGSNSVDLVSVAQALHWFSFEEFFAEVQRVLKPGGIIAAWCYPLHRISPEIDLVMTDFYQNVVGEYWPPERRFVEEGYRSITFPFQEIKTPRFTFCLDWDLAALLGYLGTWSATQRYRKKNQADPRELITSPLAAAWGAPEQKHQICWELALRVGQKSS